ncbi:MAG: sodium:solute symporter family protein [Planctomycetaceae bacterium]
MLIFCVVVYMIATVAIGVYASRRISGSKDFMVAGRSLPLYMNFACVFATWFGAETLLSVSAKFAHQGLGFISGDPFGATVCLMLVAFLFARTFYRMELLTIGDYYHKRFGKTVEVITSLAISASYLGWTSAQLTALGLVIDVLFPSLGLTNSILLGSAMVTLYTLFGGMWSVALTDLLQTGAIIVGLIIVALLLSHQVGGVNVVVQHAYENGKLHLFPHITTAATLTFVGEFITVAFGSIPQQDVFQRVTSAKDERTAFVGTLAGGLFYFIFAFVPMFIAYAAVVMEPNYAERFGGEDLQQIQKILPDLILNRTPIWCQVLFFGALLSAILSTASGTMLAPASVFTENVLRPFIRYKSDRAMLIVLRTVLISFAVAATLIATNTKSTMYDMVQNSNNVTLTMAFIPLVLGIYWSRASTQGAIVSILFGAAAWLGTKIYLHIEDSELWWRAMPPQLYGLAASFLGMIVGSMMPNWIKPSAADRAELARPSPSLGH